jgi:glutamyl-tRNA synthetase
MTEVVRTRFEPSPTGSIHVGGARTALYSWLVARHHDGTFVLRVADTDFKRVSDENYDAILEDLRWLGLTWDEGPDVGGPFAPYRQSERRDRYRAAALGFQDRGHAYRCYCTPEELEERRAAARAAGRPPGYDGRCRNLSDEERARFEAEGRSYAIRFKVPHGRTIAFDDAVRGHVSFRTDEIPDFVILRSDESATYMLAAGLDDALMNITHIVRGEDLLPATPRQLLLREAMAVADVPVFAHLPLLVTPDGRPLSKRWGDVSVRAYRDQGFTPEAMVNYLALLGWSYDDRTNIFSLDELIEKFSLERVAKNPATFDTQKLEWMNGHYIRALEPNDLADRLFPFLVRAGIPVASNGAKSKLHAVAPLLIERLKRLDEAAPMVRFLFEDVEPDDKAAHALEGEQDYLAEVAAALGGVPEWTAPVIESTLRALAERRGLKPRRAFQPIRAAVTGTLVSPPLFESLQILGRDPTIGRIRAAAERVDAKRV